jgi:beta-lactamase regulating signal transducer with metallopeptidase domain
MIMEILFQSTWFRLFVEFFLKSSLILSAALAVSFLLRKRSASLRHFLLVISFVGLLLLPILAAIAPGWGAGVLLLPGPGNAEGTAASPVPAGNIERVTVVPVSTPAVSRPRAMEKPVNHPVDKAPVFSFLADWHPYLPAIPWAAGCIFLLLKLMAGLYGTSRLARQGVSMSGYPWKQLFLLFLSKTPLKRKVRLLKNDRMVVPMTWGVLSPVVLMPAGSESWPLDQCSSVLFHELSHVKRWDFFVRLLARVSCSLYWFNPLCWLAFRQLKREQEKACDEMVVKAGIKPSTYASHLLNMKKSIEYGHYLPSAALGMAGKSELNERLLTILKSSINQKEVKVKTKISFIIIMLLAVAFIATAKPFQAPALPGDEGQPAMKTAQAPKAPAAEDKDKDKEKDKKKEKEVKVCVKVLKEGDAKAGCKVIKKIGEDCVFVSKGGEQIKVLIEEDGKGECGHKVIKLSTDELHLGESDGKHMIWVGKDGDKKLVYKIKKKKKGEKGEEKEVKEKRHIMIMSDKGHLYTPGKMEGLEEHMKTMQEALKVMEKQKAEALGTLEKRKEALEKIKDKKLKQEMKKMLEGIAGEIKSKEAAQQEALLKMEKALEKMEAQLKAKEGQLKALDIHLEEGGHKALVEIDEGEGNVFTIKKIKAGEGDFKWVHASPHMDEKGVRMRIILKGDIDKKKMSALKAAVKKLKKSLPPIYKVKAKITESSQDISVECGDDEPDKKTEEKALQSIKAFEKDIKKIFGDKKGMKKIEKKVLVEVEEKK